MIATAFIVDEVRGPTLIVKLNEPEDATVESFVAALVQTFASHNGERPFDDDIKDTDWLVCINQKGLKCGLPSDLANNTAWFCPHEQRLLDLCDEQSTLRNDWVFPTTFIYKFKKVSL